MKIFNKKKIGQILMEFVLVAILVGVVGGWTFYKMNPDLFRNYFRGSISQSSSVDSSGQMKLCPYDDSNCSSPPPPPPPVTPCVVMAIGAVEADGSKYAGLNNAAVPICTTASDDSVGISWNKGVHGHLVTGAINANDGVVNTNILDVLVNASSPYKAAKLCANLDRHGHTDWYLPSQTELSIIEVNRAVIGGFANHDYWTSTQYSGCDAVVIEFGAGFPLTHEDKDKTDHYVRCIRHD